MISSSCRNNPLHSSLSFIYNNPLPVDIYLTRSRLETRKKKIKRKSEQLISHVAKKYNEKNFIISIIFIIFHLFYILKRREHHLMLQTVKDTFAIFIISVNSDKFIRASFFV